MSRVRVAEIHLQLAELHRELADIERGAPVAASTREKPKARRKRMREAYVPERKFSDIEIARARQRAKKLGIAVR
jgi:hypothetical protein